MNSLIGIEIGGTKLQVVSGDEKGIQHRQRFTVDPAAGAQGIQEQIKAGIAAMTKAGVIRGVGAGFGGPVDWRNGRIIRSHQIEGWTGFELRLWLEQLCSAPARVDNDANVAALAEARFGAGREREPVFYVTLGSGVGGGLVTGGGVYHGAYPGEAEIGHIRLDRVGTTLESRCSGWAVDGLIREAAKRRPAGRLATLARGHEAGEAKCLATAVAAGDPDAAGILFRLCRDLAFGLSHAVHLFHPEVIILGGGLARIGEPLREGVARFLCEDLMEVFRPGPQIALAQLGEDAVPRGALVLAAEAARKPE